MQLGFTNLTPEERERRMHQHLCLYCGQSGHRRLSCPVRPPSHVQPVSVLADSNHRWSGFTLPVRFCLRGRIIDTTALLDSEAARNFMSHEFTVQHKLRTNPCDFPLTVEALDGRPLGEGRIHRLTEEVILHVGSLHSESIRFYVIHGPKHLIILGLPWLRTHNPQISWRENQIVQWDPSGHRTCLTKINRTPHHTLQISTSEFSGLSLPAEYSDLADAFSKHKAAQLPEHLSSDCTIELLPGI